MSVDCGAESLNGRVCVKPANHAGDHRAKDRRPWPRREGRTPSHIEKCKRAAADYGWEIIPHPEWPDRTCDFVKDGQTITVWFGPKGNLSCAELLLPRVPGQHWHYRILPPGMAVKVLEELTRR